MKRLTWTYRVWINGRPGATFDRKPDALRTARAARKAGHAAHIEFTTVSAERP